MSDDHNLQIDLDPALLARYFAGECTRAEAAAFERWTAARPERTALVAELREVWRAGAVVARVPVDAEAGWAKIVGQLVDYRGGMVRPMLRIDGRERMASMRMLPTRPGSMRSRLVRRLAIAAIIVLALGGAWLARRSMVAVSPTMFASYATEPGSWQKLALRDGTHVILGPMSKLRILSAMDAASGSPREVELDGLGFFQVAHDPRRPFRVRAHGAEARVLGTEFTVRAYGNERDIEVAVRSGRVAVRGRNQIRSRGGPVVMAGHLAVVAPDGRVMVDSITDPSVFAWTSGSLRFESARLGDVAREMSRWIGLTIVVADSALSTTMVTVAFPDLSRDSVLARLAGLAGAQPIQVRQGLVLFGKPAPDASPYP